MATSIIKDTPKVLRKGNNTFNVIVGGYITGSGNYVSTFIPCLLDKGISSATLKTFSGVNCYTPSGVLTLSSFDTSYSGFNIMNNGFSAEFKFNSTHTPNIPCTLNIQFSVTFA